VRRGKSGIRSPTRSRRRVRPVSSTPGRACASSPSIQGGSRMRESRPYGSVLGHSVMSVLSAISSWSIQTGSIIRSNHARRSAHAGARAIHRVGIAAKSHAVGLLSAGIVVDLVPEIRTGRVSA
jgi:hypothetical protein